MSLLGNQDNEFEKQLKKQLSDTEFKPSESLWDRIDKDVNRPVFEQKVGSKLNQFQVTPSEETWEQIEAQLPPEPRRWKPIGKIWYGLFLLLFSGGITIGYFITKHQQLKLAERDALVLTPESKPQNQTQGVFNKQAIEKKSVEKESDLGEALYNKKSGVNTKIHSNQDVQPHAQGADISKKTPLISSIKQEKPNASPTRVESIGNLAQQQETVVPTSQIAPLATEAPKNSITINNATNLPALPLNSAVINNDSDKSGSNVTEEPTLVVPVQQQVLLIARDSLKGLPAPDAGASLDFIGKLISPISDSVTKASTHTAPNKPSSKISITILAGAHMSNMALGEPAGREMSNNINLRKQVERPKADITAGFLLDYHLNKRWIVSGGVFVTNFKMDMVYNTSPTNQSAQKEPKARYIHPNDSIFNGSGEYNQGIRYSWNEIPLLLTFNFNPGKRLSFEIKSGLSYAIINTVDANMISYNNVGVLVLKGKESFPQIRNSVFAHVYAGISYRLNETVSLNAMPYFRYSVNSMIRNENWVQQRPYLTGMSLSLRKYF